MSDLNGFPRLRNLKALRASESCGKSNFVDADRIENFSGGDRLGAVVDWVVSGNVRMAAARGRLHLIRASVTGFNILMITFTNFHLFNNAHSWFRPFVEICSVYFGAWLHNERKQQRKSADQMFLLVPRISSLPKINTFFELLTKLRVWDKVHRMHHHSF